LARYIDGNPRRKAAMTIPATVPHPSIPTPIPSASSPPARQAIIIVDHVSKRFGDTTAVDDLTFAVSEGEIFGFIGPSGSGKTTTLRLLTGIYAPTAGTVRLLGVDPTRPTRRLHEGVGYLPQQFVLYPNLTVYEN